MPDLSRRGFLALTPLIATLTARPEHLVLEAIAAERMPQRVVVRGVERAAFFEVRDYGAAGARVASVLCRRGIRPVWQGKGRFLFAFKTLEERERIWREICAEPEWMGLGLALREITVYRRV
jgi:hypothetical protein